MNNAPSMITLAAFTGASMLWAGCSRSPDRSAELVGVWRIDFPSSNIHPNPPPLVYQQVEETIRPEFKSDQTCTIHNLSGPGTWTMEGNKVMLVFKNAKEGLVIAEYGIVPNPPKDVTVVMELDGHILKWRPGAHDKENTLRPDSYLAYKKIKS